MIEFAEDLAQSLKPVKPFFPHWLDEDDPDFEAKLAQAHKEAGEANWPGVVAVVVKAAPTPSPVMN